MAQKKNTDDNIAHFKNTLKEWASIYDSDFKKDFMPDLIGEHEFSETGFLSSYYRKILNGLAVDCHSFFKYVLLTSQVSHFIKAIEVDFLKVNIAKLRGNQMVIKIPNNNGKSIGFLFGRLGQMKLDFSIK